MYYLFSDDEVWHKEIEAPSWRSALYQARDMFQIKGRLVLKTWVGDARDYHLSNSNYNFTLRIVYD